MNLENNERDKGTLMLLKGKKALELEASLYMKTNLGIETGCIR